MKSAGRVVWRRCASHWRRVSSNMETPVTRPLSAADSSSQRLSTYQSGSMSQPASISVPGAMSQRAPFSVPGAMSQCLPVRSLCLSAQSLLCWSCQSVVSRAQLFCPSCSSLQPPDETKDFFHVLDCDRSFNVDIQELQKKYRNLQRVLHPDYFNQKPQYERDISEEQSSLVNKAYNTLLSPLSRGIYLLSLHGITFTEGTEGGVAAPFLFEILEINEDLHETSSSAEIEDIGIFIQAKCQSLTENIRDSFQKGDFEGAKVFLAKMKYYSNILDQVKKKIIP